MSVDSLASHDLSDLLKPGSPVIVTSHNFLEGCFDSRSAKLFFTDGVIKNNLLGVQASRNLVYASLEYKKRDSSLSVPELSGEYSIKCLPGSHAFVEVSDSYFGFDEDRHDDGYGNPQFIVRRSYGSGSVLPVDSVKFADALTALRFASEAIHFRLPHFYYSGSESVLRAIEGLLSKAVDASGINSPIHESGTSCTLNELVYGNFEHKLVGKKMPDWWKHYGLLPSDYKIVSDACYAFVKVDGSDAFIKPVLEHEPNIALIAELAVLPDFVKRFFPEGLNN